MLKAWKAQLKTMLLDPADPFTAAIRRLAGPRGVILYAPELRHMIQSVPDMTARIRRHAENRKLSSALRRWQGFVLAYLYRPKDFLRRGVPGLFGYLDDAYIVARVFDRTLREAPGVAYLKGIPGLDVLKWIDMTRRLLPKETTRIDRTMNKLEQGDTKDFFWIFLRSRPSSRKGKNYL